MKKAKSFNFIIPLVVYPFDCMVSLNENWDKFGVSVTKKWGAEILDDFTKSSHATSEGLSYVYTSDSMLCCMIKIHNFKKDAQGYSDLQHEIFHATEFILRKCGMELNSNSHEAYAYLCGYLTKEIYKKIL